MIRATIPWLLVKLTLKRLIFNDVYVGGVDACGGDQKRLSDSLELSYR